jgi:predicted AlkP superfamily pyrophosphatase or phosphodiesterase
MARTVVINVVGLTPKLIGAHTPQIKQWADRAAIASVTPTLPAVTCTMQATYLTGKTPRDHGIVANGWYFREECEVKFWRQSNRLVQAPKIWELAKQQDESFTCANLFWWYNMYSTVDYAVTPRPMYPADGRKLPDIHSHPPELRQSLQSDLGPFPLFKFWGPATSIESSQWIANSAKAIEQQHAPTLSLVYLPHLDYCTQQRGGEATVCQKDLQEIDRLVGDLIGFYEDRGVQVILLSEYGITTVSQPVHLNRRLREAGFITVREELGRELLDAGASRAFAVADHQLAHVYVNNPTDLEQVQQLLEGTPGVAKVLDARGKAACGLDHERAGEFVVIAEPEAWFTYYYWLDEAKAPDFANTVDIHRKPGYDPAELFINPNIRFPKLKLAQRLLQKKLGFRTLMDVIPTNGAQVRGSHGHIPKDDGDRPLFLTRSIDLKNDRVEATEVFDLIWAHLFDPQP